jgi:hypothetical protein
MRSTPSEAGEPGAPSTLLPAQAELLGQLAVLLGMPASQGSGLMAPQLINGPIGLACRLHLQPGAAAVRPEVLLPLRANAFSGAGLERLLAVQALLLAELGWYLGMTADHLLSVGPMDWVMDAPSAAAALDMANGVGLAALQALLVAEPQARQVQA